MASYAVHEFLGDGVLKEITQKLADDGWDDVPTLKMMQAEDMEAIDLTDPQRDALELRIYLHDRSLMEYADKMEQAGKNLPELLITSPAELTSLFGMRKADVSRFTDRSLACGIKMPPTHALMKKARTRAVVAPATQKPVSAAADQTTQVPKADHDHHNNNKTTAVVDAKVLDGRTHSKAIYRAAPTPQLCGFGMSDHAVVEDVTQLSVLENIILQKLTPVHKAGRDTDMAQLIKKRPPPFKASELWATKPTLVFCLRRPGCVMCRGEAHQLYARKPIFDAMGVQLVVVLNENIESEVKAFWPHYWGGMVLVDESREFFKALGGGKLPKGNLITGFAFNPQARQNWKRAKATGIKYNTNGEGTIKGGLYVLGSGKTGVVYQFIERNFGDWAPLDEVIKVCENL
ncbi:unnamed protein product [Sphagnum jensenii]|uniref:Peroxiredoxin-like 2A n=1 Tax=Sphagnum jensenii TaxID=128206 RepID=A0ABP0WT50_9BRYO